MRWSLSRDETVIAATLHQTIGLWSVDDGSPIAVLQATVARPCRQVPNGSLAQKLHARAAALIWEVQGAKFVHTGDGRSRSVTPIQLSRDERLITVPTQWGLALIALDDNSTVRAVMPMEGNLRGACLMDDMVLAVNSAGKVYRWRLTAGT